MWDGFDFSLGQSSVSSSLQVSQQASQQQQSPSTPTSASSISASSIAVHQQQLLLNRQMESQNQLQLERAGHDKGFYEYAQNILPSFVTSHLVLAIYPSPGEN
jgi:hypothetical protein